MVTACPPWRALLRDHVILTGLATFGALALAGHRAKETPNRDWRITGAALTRLSGGV
jgi:hypothetical protein